MENVLLVSVLWLFSFFGVIATGSVLGLDPIVTNGVEILSVALFEYRMIKGV